MPEFREDDEKFLKYLKQGHDREVELANRINSFGLVCFVPPLLIREDVNLDQFQDREFAAWVAQHLATNTVRGDFINSQDIIIEPGILDYILELKSRDIRFTSVENFPFPTIIIDTVFGYNAKDPKPHLYGSLSQKTSAAIFTSGRHPERWSTEHFWDSKRRTREYNYTCSKKFWHSFTETMVTLRHLKEIHLREQVLVS